MTGRIGVPPAPRPARPTLDARLIAWRKAYDHILTEMSRAPLIEDRITAATVAAQLVIGAELEDSHGDNG